MTTSRYRFTEFCQVGLDPTNLDSISALLFSLANTSSPLVLIALRPQDFLPDWITHTVLLGLNTRILYKGPKEQIHNKLSKLDGTCTEVDRISPPEILNGPRTGYANKVLPPKVSSLIDRKSVGMSRDGLPLIDAKRPSLNCHDEPLIEMENVQIKYGTKQVLGGWKEKVDGTERSGLWWTIRRGERWGVFGPNGTSQIELCLGNAGISHC